jgi:hypothetical protein
VINQAMPDLRRIVMASHAVIDTILKALGAKLGLRPGTLESFHRVSEISGDQIRFIKAQPYHQDMDEQRASLGAHTDFGSVVRVVSFWLSV